MLVCPVVCQVGSFSDTPRDGSCLVIQLVAVSSLWLFVGFGVSPTRPVLKSVSSFGAWGVFFFFFTYCVSLIVTDALEDHEGTVSIAGRAITNLRFADDIDGLAGEEEELAKSVERLDKVSTAYGTKISAEKTKLRTNNTSGINTEIKVNGQKLETVSVTSFKYMGSLISDEGSKLKILSRIAQTTAALTKLKLVWNDRSIALSSKIRMVRSLVTSIFLYACESQ